MYIYFFGNCFLFFIAIGCNNLSFVVYGRRQPRAIIEGDDEEEYATIEYVDCAYMSITLAEHNQLDIILLYNDRFN